jgi:threonine/homoserine/homoserine lactone efflux protein
MSWSRYAEFLGFAMLLILVPGPDFAVVTKNTLAGGQRRGVWTAIGVSSSNFVQGTAAACGLSALIMHAIRGLLARRKVRRALDATTGTVLIGFSARLALEHT